MNNIGSPAYICTPDKGTTATYLYMGYGNREYIITDVPAYDTHRFRFCLYSRNNLEIQDDYVGTGHLYSRYGIQTSSGLGDFAEMFEWEDGNPENEKRVGYTVLVNEEGFIRKATMEDNPNDIIGVVSATATITGSAAAFDYNKKYLKDDFEQTLLDASGNAMINPDYDESLSYKNRSERPEWDPIGICGKLIVRNGCPINPKWRLIGTRQTAKIYLA